MLATYSKWLAVGRGRASTILPICCAFENTFVGKNNDVLPDGGILKQSYRKFIGEVFFRDIYL